MYRTTNRIQSISFSVRPKLESHHGAGHPGSTHASHPCAQNIAHCLTFVDATLPTWRPGAASGTCHLLRCRGARPRGGAFVRQSSSIPIFLPFYCGDPSDAGVVRGAWALCTPRCLDWEMIRTWLRPTRTE